MLQLLLPEARLRLVRASLASCLSRFPLKSQENAPRLLNLPSGESSLIHHGMRGNPKAPNGFRPSVKFRNRLPTPKQAARIDLLAAIADSLHAEGEFESKEGVFGAIELRKTACSALLSKTKTQRPE